MPGVGIRNRWPLLSLLCVPILAGFALGGAWLVRSTPASPLQRGLLAYGREDWASAEKGARERLKSRPDDPEGLRLLARALLQQQRDQPAMALCERLGDRGLEAEDFFLLGQALIRSGKKESAIQLWRRAVGKDPHHNKTWVSLAQIFFQLDLLNEAARAADLLSAQPGWEARANLMLGQIRAAQSDPAGAARAYQIVLDHLDEWRGIDDLGQIRKRQARFLLQLGKPAQARAELSKLTADAADDPETRWLVSRCDLQEGKESVEAVLAGALAFRESHPLEPEPSPFVGEARCNECHQPIFQEQHRSRHARTFPRGEQLRAIPFPQQPVADPGNPKVTHTFQKSQNQIKVDTNVDGRVFQTIVDYAFGSGDRGLTLVGHDRQNQSFEYRLSFYSHDVGWDVTSGHPVQPDLPAELYQGMVLTSDAVRRCFVCHVTNPQAVLTNSGPESSDQAIGCEFCHGPGDNHLKAVASLQAKQIKAGRFPKDADLSIARPTKASGAAIVGLCGQCHSPRDPNLKLSPGSPDSVRFQGTTLSWSRCYNESGNKLDCVTCHDPHHNVVTSSGWYDSRCLHCHSSGVAEADGVAAKTTCPVEPSKNCVGCHMPKVTTPMAHARFTDHFIRVHRDSEPSEKHANKPGS